MRVARSHAAAARLAARRVLASAVVTFQGVMATRFVESNAAHIPFQSRYAQRKRDGMTVTAEHLTVNLQVVEDTPTPESRPRWAGLSSAARMSRAVHYTLPATNGAITSASNFLLVGVDAGLVHARVQGMVQARVQARVQASV